MGSANEFQERERTMNSNRTTTLPFSVENNELDSHHRLILELFDKVEAAIASNHKAVAVSKSLSQLRDFASYHFGAEEALFELLKGIRALEVQ